MQIQTPLQESDVALRHYFSRPGELDFVTGLVHEGLDQPEPDLQDQQLAEVADLVGNLAVYDALRIKVNNDRYIAEMNAAKFKARRAQESAKNMESQGFAKTAPNFIDQVEDSSRQTEFITNRLPSNVKSDGWPLEKRTEAQGLGELFSFLQGYVMRNGVYTDGADVKNARNMFENLTFIGSKEYAEATLGIAQLWKNYLDEDPDHKICALTKVSNSAKYPGMRKSDDYLRDSILSSFTDEELEKYSGRIVNSIDDIQDNSPDKTKVVLIDDWVISGQQARRVYDNLKKDPYFEPFEDSLEVNVIVASEDRIVKGLKVDNEDPNSPSIPVKSYFKSHYVEDAKTENKGHVSGLHSTVNYDFEDIIRSIVYKDTPEGQNPQMPALASIIKPYRNSKPNIEITGSQLKRVA